MGFWDIYHGINTSADSPGNKFCQVCFFFFFWVKNTRITRTKAKGKIYFLSLDSGVNVNRDVRMTE